PHWTTMANLRASVSSQFAGARRAPRPSMSSRSSPTPEMRAVLERLRIELERNVWRSFPKCRLQLLQGRRESNEILAIARVGDVDVVRRVRRAAGHSSHASDQHEIHVVRNQRSQDRLGPKL